MSNLTMKEDADSSPAKTTTPDGNFGNAGPFGLLSPDLILYLLDHANVIDRLVLGRSCKWLHSIAQQTSEWQTLFHPLSALAPLTRPVLGTNSLPARLTHGFLVCLPMGRISKCFAWIPKESPQTLLRVDDAVCAAPLKFSSIKVPPLPSSHAARPSNVYESHCRDGCNVCMDFIVGNDSLKLPLFINADHFESGVPLLQDQLTCAILDPRPRVYQYPPSTKSSPDPGPPIPHTIITTFFPQLVRNTVARFALSANAPTVNDVEALVQVHMVWRAYIHRFALDAPSWIRNKLQALVNQLKRGGVHARQVPLMELVSLLHVTTDKDLTWRKLAHAVVEENTIRLFEFARACGQCTAKLKDLGADRIGESVLRLANKVAAERVDGYGFVPWQILLVHARFLRATSSIPTMAPLASFARIVGQFKDNQHLVPGPIARLLHTFLDRDIRPPLSGLCASWSGIWRGLGAVPMQPAALAKWLDWCDTQVKCRRANLSRVNDNAPRYSYRLRFCDICPLPPRSDIGDSRFQYPAPTMSMSLCYSTSTLTALQPSRQREQHVLPDVTWVALNRHGALLYAHSDRHKMDGTRSGFFTKDSFSTTGLPSCDGSQPEVRLHLHTLDSRVAFVAAIASSKSYPKSIVSASGYFNDEYDRERQVRAKPKGNGSTVSRLSFVSCRGLDDQQWDLVRATAVPRHGGWAGTFLDQGEHLWVVESEQEVASVAECVSLAQEWVVEYVQMCRANGLNALGVSMTDQLP